MKVIRDISDDIEKELDMAEHYIALAFLYAVDFPDAAKNYYNLSTARMTDILSLHNKVVDIINTYKNKNGEPPADMLAVYKYLHQKHIEHNAKILKLQEEYKAGF